MPRPVQARIAAPPSREASLRSVAAKGTNMNANDQKAAIAALVLLLDRVVALEARLAKAGW